MIEILYSGGLVMGLLGLLTLVSITVFFVRLADFRRTHTDYADFVRGVVNLLERDNAEEALAICDETPGPVARITAAAVRHRTDAERERERVVDVVGRAEAARYERRLSVLALAGQIAPTLGLLGTFLGMIETIGAINASEPVSRVELFDGLDRMLMTAAAGIVCCIAAQLMYGHLRSQLERMVSELESAAETVLAAIQSSGKASR